MRGILIFLLLHVTITIVGQQLEVIGGAMIPSFYAPVFSSQGDADFQGNTGYTAGISLWKLNIDGHNLGVAVSLDSYNGEWSRSSHGQGNSFSSVVDIKRHELGISLFPLDVTILKKFCLGVGFKTHLLLANKTNGYARALIFGFGESYRVINDGEDILMKAYFGIVGRIAYCIKISNEWYLMPQYGGYMGWTPEFEGNWPRTKSWRQYFNLGVRHSLRD